LVASIARADNAVEFQKVADRGPIEDAECTRFGGVAVPVTDEEVKTIIRNAKNVEHRLYYQGYVYVMYGSRAQDVKNLVVPTYNLTLCRFSK